MKRISGLPDQLFSCCVDIDYEALTTSDNADQASAWARHGRFNRLIVVTSSYHMPRSLTELRRTLPGVKLVPHPVFSHRLQTRRWWTDAFTARVLFAEYVKFLPSAARYSVGPPAAVGQRCARRGQAARPVLEQVRFRLDHVDPMPT